MEKERKLALEIIDVFEDTIGNSIKGNNKKK